ncbi:WhiB family transcriptional regulator [Streptomyces chartreusis]|uniref:WhiB family transcriptional regulator n=1 Tax=Streptomyces chartreusis TaxID=1969 RepID=UPI003715F5AB
MSHYSGSVPDTEPARKWLAKAACRAEGVDPDEMFPDNNTKAIDKAKRICRPCPVWRECLLDSIRVGETEFGIRGGLKPEERRQLADSINAGDTVTLPKPKAKKFREARPETLAEAVRRRTVRSSEGHLLWNGAAGLRFQNVRYTALQAAFIVGHSREPVGMVRRTCGEECYRADHLTDTVIRDSGAKCGTTAGFHRHIRQGEQPCAACKRSRSIRWPKAKAVAA